ncbi:tetratricopeptide repeat-containing sulfotransferase family protein [Phenylobacterium sp.]|uniref:tetratricopeptide repeat-containing sulfotransferase family protein n=1 Tax=Phenylobacterium sp. TaxID=1871053 RepID=UPI0012111F93|nr:tetratricopeptide repeat-containing sulfotransferase family protein [Phenylobacterium sp.]THD71072.1 MAG: sulfotransferase family protein [Phenylobacterium sp.]
MTSWKSGPISLKIAAAAPAPAARDPAGEKAALAEIGAAVQARDFERAGRLAERALAGGLEHPAVLNLAALKLEGEERFEDAVRLLQRAVALAPGDPGARNALGLCLRRLERDTEALAQFDQAVAIAPAFAGAHGARGGCLESLGRLNEAEAAFRRAIELQPENLGGLAGLANLMSRRGAHAEARAMADKVLAAQPGYPDAVNVAAAAELADGDAPAAQARLEAVIPDPRLTPQQLAFAQGLLGDVLDARDRIPEAFSAYAACNMGLWRTYAATYGAPPSALEFAHGMIGRLEAIDPKAWTAAGEPAPGATGHVFLLGFPRSGTTLLEQVLASHPEVRALEERETLSAAMRAFLAAPQDLDRLAVASEGELAPLRAAYWARVREEGAQVEGKLFVDKHPLNTFKLPLIARLFPQARILFAQRDPRDVVLSCYRRRFVMSGSAYQLLTLPGAAGYYDAAMQVAERLAPALAGRTHVVRHEALIEDFDGVVGAVCAFLGLPWTDDLRAFSNRTRDRGIATPSGAQLAGGLSAEGVGQWRRYRQQMAPALPKLAPWVERFGYAPQ